MAMAGDHFALVGLGVNRSHGRISLSCFSQEMKLFIESRTCSLREHVASEGKYISILHQRVTLYFIVSFSKSLYCFPTHPYLYIVSFHSRSMLLEHGSFFCIGAITYASTGLYVR